MANLIDFLNLSLASLKKRPLRTGLTLLGIFIGIAAVVSLISLGDGLRTAITGQFGSLSADTLTLQNSGTGFGPPGSTAIRKLNENDLEIVKSVSGVKLAVSRLIRIAKINYNQEVKFGYVASMPKDSEACKMIYDSFQAEASEGRLLEISDKDKVVLGSEYAKEGYFDKPIRVGGKFEIQGKDFQIAGILKTTSTIQVNLAILMNEDDMKTLLNIGDEIDIIAIRVENKENINQVAQEIERRLRQDRGEKIGEEDFSVQTPLQALGAINTILNIINLIVTGIASISLLIGGINISNSMYTSVLERTREIGIMKAIGAKNSDIMLVFLIEAGLLGAIGGITGAGLGIGFAFLAASSANAFFGEQIIKVSINYSLLGYAILFSLGIGILSGVFPARQASKLKPVDVLRG